MLLTKNFNTVIKNKWFRLLATTSLALIGFISHIQVPALAAETQVTAQICQNGQKTVKLVDTTPANHNWVELNHVNYKIRTDWASKLMLKLNNQLVFDQAVEYRAGVETTIPLNDLVASPQVNQISLTIKGGCPEQTITRNIQLNFRANTLTYDQQSTKNRSPELTGQISNQDLEVRVYISGRNGFFRGLNHHNGRWSLPAGSISPELADGIYDITIESFNPTLNKVVLTSTHQKGLIIDNIAPKPSFNNSNQDQTNRSPELAGTVDDPKAKVQVIINNQVYDAINNGDGTWKLPAGTIKPLANGRYDVIIRVIDSADNRSEIQTIIHINAQNNLGFIIAPNTGYWRLGRVNIPSWLLYLITFLIIGGIVISYKCQAQRS